MTTRAMRRWSGGCLVMAAVVVGLLGCGEVVFRGGPARTQAASSSGPSESVLVLEAQSLRLEPVTTISTGTLVPQPVFSGDGRWLAYHDAQGPEHVGGGGAHGEHSSRVHVVDLRSLVDRTVYESTHEVPSLPALRYEYEMYEPYAYAQPSLLEPEQGFSPAFLGERVLMSAARPANRYDGPMTRLVGLEGDQVRPFGPHGTWPRVSADGQRVLLQMLDGLVEVDAAGTELATYPGFLGVWAPQGYRFLAQVTPWSLGPTAGGLDWRSSSWPEEMRRPVEDRGGLYLGEGGVVTPLVESGGRPSWHPDGRRFVYERPQEAGSGRGPRVLAEVELGAEVASEGLRERELVSGRAPVVHPGGRFVVYEDPAQGLSVLPLGASFDDAPGAPQPLGIAGVDARFSADGRWLVVSVPRRERRLTQGGVELAVYRVVAQEE